MRFTVQFFLSLQDHIGELKQELETERQAHATAMQDALTAHSSICQGKISRLREEIAIMLQKKEASKEVVIAAFRKIVDG